MPPFRFFSQRRLGSLVALISLGFSIWALWYGVNSDRDDVAPLLRQLIPAGHCACRTSTVFNCGGCLDANVRVVDGAGPQWEFQYHVNGNARTLSQARCSAAFPGLCEDLWHSKEFWKGRISTADLDSFPLVDGTTRALIYNGELYAVATKSKAEDHRRKAVAILSSIHRALVSAPDRAAIRNMEFIFSIEDKAEDINANGHPVWTLARKATEHSLWLMPDFGFWAWDNIIGDAENAIGSYDEIVHNVETLEANLPFEHKKRQLAWRGKLSFAPKLRRALLDQSRVHEWGDVKEVEWQQRTNYLSLEDHCKYQFIAHAEGRWPQAPHTLVNADSPRPLVLSIPQVPPGVPLGARHTQTPVHPAPPLPPRPRGPAPELRRSRARLLRPAGENDPPLGESRAGADDCR